MLELLHPYRPSDSANYLQVVPLREWSLREIFHRQTIGDYVKLAGINLCWNALRHFPQDSFAHQHVCQKLAHRAQSRRIMQDLGQPERGVRMNIAPAHPDSKWNARKNMYLAGHFSGFACEMRINQFHLALVNKRNTLPNQLLIADVPGIKMEDRNVI